VGRCPSRPRKITRAINKVSRYNEREQGTDGNERRKKKKERKCAYYSFVVAGADGKEWRSSRVNPGEIFSWIFHESGARFFRVRMGTGPGSTGEGGFWRNR
jgi:hypothetical protein